MNFGSRKITRNSTEIFLQPSSLFLALSLLLTLTALSGCIGKNDISVSVKKHAKKTPTTEPLPPVTVSNIQIVNHQIVITGTNLDSVQQFKIKEGSTNTNLQIESQTSTSIVANTISNVTFAAGKILDFIFTNAEAAATFTVNFSLCDSTLGGKAFNCTLTPNDKEVLSYDAASGKWQPRAVNGLSYIGSYDASSGANPAIKPAGQYYIISVAGDMDAGATILGVGDWIVSNGTVWQKIDNSTAIISVHGRTGAVVGDEGDYSLTQLSDTTITAPVNNQILKYNGTTWVNSDLSALGGGTVTSVSGTAPISVTNGTSTPAISISQATTTTNGYLSSVDWNTFNNKQPTITAGTTAQYYRGDKSWQTLDTSVVPENTNLYFTNARALGVPLTGFATDTNAIVATDSILQAFGKAQGQINNLTAGGSNFLVKNGSDTITGVVNVNTIGALAIGYTPTNMTDATSKSYVDAQRDTRVAKTGDSMSGDLSLDTKLRFKDSTVNYVELKAPAAVTTYTLTLPAAKATIAGQVLTSDTSGNLTWTTPATGGAPTGAAGGELSGTYPNPTIAANAITDTHIAANAISQSKINGLTTALSGKEPAITAGTTAQYLRGDKSLSTFANDVWATVLTGLSTATNAAITATDSVLVAFGKLQAQISANTTAIGNKADQTNGTQTITAAAVTGLSAPVAGSDAANKDYVDGFAVWSKGAGANTGDIYRATGKVGIGTATPSAMLTVTGDAKINGLTVGNGTAGWNYSTIVGYNALSSITGDYANTAIGAEALMSVTSGQENTAVGYAVLSANTGNKNSGLGVYALQYSTGDENTAMGWSALGANTTGSFNTAFGNGAGTFTKTGSANTLVGSGAGYGLANNSYSNNTVIGSMAGYALRTGSNNILLGYKAGEALTTGTKNIVIGYDIDAPAVGSTNTLNIGNLIYGTTLDGTNTTLSTGKIGIGVAAPAAKLDVAGAIKVGADAGLACDGTTAGAMRFNTPNVQYCNGTAWTAFSASGAGTVSSTELADGTIVDADVSATANITATKLGTGVVDNTEFNYLNGVTSAIQTQLDGKEPTITAGTTAQYLRGDKSLSTFATDVLATVLTGLSTATNAVIAATDSVLVSFGKLQAQISANTTALSNKLDKTGGTLSVGTINGVPTPVNSDDIVNKGYVDSYGQWTKGVGGYAGDVYRATGNVGIGTSTPNQKLVVGDDIGAVSANNAAVIGASGTSNTQVFMGNDGNNFSNFLWNGTDKDLIFRVKNAGTLYTNQFVLDSSGNVGIGTKTPVMLLDVNGGARVLASVEGAEANANSGASITIADLSKNIRRITLTANTTITLPDVVADTNLPTDAAYSLTLKIKQDGTGSRTITWAAGAGESIKWDMGSAPAPSTAASSETIYQCMIIGGETNWYCSMVWQEQ